VNGVTTRRAATLSGSSEMDGGDRQKRFCCDPLQIDGVGNPARKKFAQGFVGRLGAEGSTRWLNEFGDLMVSIVSLARAISFLDAWKSFLKASRSMPDSSCSRRFVFQKFIAVGCGIAEPPLWVRVCGPEKFGS